MTKQQTAKNVTAPKPRTRYVMRMMRENKKAVPVFLILCLVSIGTVALSIYAPLLISDATNTIAAAFTDGVFVAGAIDFAALFRTLSILLYMYLIILVADLASNVSINNMVTRMFTQGYRLRISRTIKTLPVKFVDNSQVGDVLSRMMDDVGMVGGTAGSLVRNLVSGFAQIVGIAIAMFMINIWLALVILVMIPLSLVIAGSISKKISKYFDDLQKETGELNSYIQESFSAHSIIKAYNLAEHNHKGFADINVKIRDTAYKAYSIGGIIEPIMTLINNLGYVAVCILGAYLAVNRVIDLGSILAMIIYARMFSGPLGNMGEISFQMQRFKGAAKRVYGILDEPPMADETNKPAIRPFDKRLDFENVNFAYNEKAKAVQDFSLYIKQNQKIAIVGPTGCGKTTLVNLLMRFYDATTGDIKIDGGSIYDANRETVREIFSMVLQDVWLFHGTIRENIVYGNPSATQEQIEAACKNANVDHFINTMPEGYETVINEDATNLSNGQKQLITIARAILADKPVLILDEATSNVDSLTELLVQQAMTALMKEKTSFVIAHRLSTIVDSDLIVVMRDGRIIEKGTHEELLDAGGFYSDLYYSQFKNGSGEILSD